MGEEVVCIKMEILNVEVQLKLLRTEKAAVDESSDSDSLFVRWHKNNYGLCQIVAGPKMMSSVLTNLKFLVLLQLRDCGLERLPPEILAMKSLEYLYLSCNRLNDLPKGLAELTQLKHLHLRKNEFTRIPAVAYKLENITCLAIGGNPIEDFGELPKAWTGMQSFTFGSRSLKVFPRSVIQFPKLTCLRMRGTTLQTIPEGLGQLSKLSFLDVSRNHLVRLPSDLWKCRNLCMIIANDNKITRVLPENYEPPLWSKLSTLDLDNNCLTSFPRALGNLRHLLYIKISGNQLLHIPYALFTARRSLEAYNNPMLSPRDLEQIQPRYRHKSPGNLVDLASAFILTMRPHVQFEEADLPRTLAKRLERMGHCETPWCFGRYGDSTVVKRYRTSIFKEYSYSTEQYVCSHNCGSEGPAYPMQYP